MSLAALAAAELALHAAVPGGVLDVVIGDRRESAEICKTWCDNSTVWHVNFTGSADTARALVPQGSSLHRKLLLALGGRSPLIVLDDADTDAAVDNAFASCITRGG